MKSSHVPAPVFINGLLKYIVHNLAWIRVVGNWVSVHSARKLARPWDFMAFLGRTREFLP
jgi:hypothetical protein